MKNRHLILIIVVALFCTTCATVPYTGRKQFNLFGTVYPVEQEIQLGEQAYEEVLKENKKSSREEWQQMIGRVGQRIKAVSDKPDYNWEFNVLNKNRNGLHSSSQINRCILSISALIRPSEKFL